LISLPKLYAIVQFISSSTFVRHLFVINSILIELVSNKYRTCIEETST